jgi:hypothetical protein
LKSNVNNNGERRLQNTEQHTLLNSVEISKERRNKITILNQGIKSILQYQELLKVQPKISSESLIEFFQTKIIEEKRNIMEQLKLPNFKRLTHEHYLKLLEKYPNLTKI